LLAACTESPPYDADMLVAVVVFGVNVTLQVPTVRLHVVAENDPAPPVVVNEIVPVGVVAPAPLLSSTVMLQVDA